MSGGRREPRLLLRRRELEMPRADVEVHWHWLESNWSSVSQLTWIQEDF
jgi:hypothetical protein